MTQKNHRQDEEIDEIFHQMDMYRDTYYNAIKSFFRQEISREELDATVSECKETMNSLESKLMEYLENDK